MMIPRYDNEEMAKVWADKAKYALWILIEQTAMDVMYKHQIIPERITFPIQESGLQEFMAACKEREKATQHDVVAFLSVLEDVLGKPGRFIHFGMTSSDLVDTCFALQMKNALELIKAELLSLHTRLLTKAQTHKHDIIIGRTHGQRAEPSTFGLMLLEHWCEIGRNIARLNNAINTISVGKLSGAVGNFLHIPNAIEDKTMKDLGIRPNQLSTQVICRDQHAEVFNTLSLIGCALERLALRIRLLGQSEIKEVAEGHKKGYKGSSAMPHKSNNIGSENITGLARMLRGYAQIAMENTGLWLERDISHSSCERIIAPDATHITIYIIKRMSSIINDLVVYTDTMRQHVFQSDDWKSQGYMLELIQSGTGRTEAHQQAQAGLDGYFDKLVQQPDVFNAYVDHTFDLCVDKYHY